MKRVLVTGGTGFVGSFTVEKYLAANWQVRALVRDSQKLRWLQGLNIELAVGVLTDKNALGEAVRDCDAVVQCAALTKSIHREDYYRINAMAVGEFVDIARGAGVKRFILCSSQAAAGPSQPNNPTTEADEPRPLTEYGLTKLAGERLLIENAGDMEWVILRPPSVMGPRDEQFLPLFKSIQRNGLYPRFCGGGQRYSIISVHDLARALLTAGEATTGINNTYFVAAAHPLSWEYVATILGHLVGKKVRALPLHRPVLELVALGATLREWITKEPALLSREKIREIMADQWICSTEKIRAAWNFECDYDIPRMLADTLAGYRNAGWL